MHTNHSDTTPWQQSAGAMWFLIGLFIVAILFSFYVGVFRLGALAGAPAGVEHMLETFTLMAVATAWIAAGYRREMVLLGGSFVWVAGYFSLAFWIPVPNDINHAMLFSAPAISLAAIATAAWWLSRCRPAKERQCTACNVATSLPKTV